MAGRAWGGLKRALGYLDGCASSEHWLATRKAEHRTGCTACAVARSDGFGAAQEVLCAEHSVICSCRGCAGACCWPAGHACERGGGSACFGVHD
jgi:hypothetical protein